MCHILYPCNKVSYREENVIKEIIRENTVTVFIVKNLCTSIPM